jgi:hypothetical protein
MRSRKAKHFRRRNSLPPRIEKNGVPGEWNIRWGPLDNFTGGDQIGNVGV